MKEHDSRHNRLIEELSDIIRSDGVSPDETDPDTLAKYAGIAKTRLHVSDSQAASRLVDESLLYLQLKSAPDMDPLADGEKFGVGFS